MEVGSAGGMELWLESFASICVLNPLWPQEADVPRDKVASGKAKTIQWRAIDSLRDYERLYVVPLPWGYGRVAALRYTPRVRQEIRLCMERARYVFAAMGGLRGDWPGILADEARRANKPYALLADRAEHHVARIESRGMPLQHRLSAQVMAFRMQRWHEKLIRGSSLTLCHGASTYEAYRSLSDSVVLVQPGYLREKDVLDEPATEDKAHRIATRDPQTPLRIVYAGRTAAMKGPLDWVEMLAEVRRLGMPFTACWYGDGPLQSEFIAALARHKLTEVVEVPGFVDRSKVFDDMTTADLFVFCHKTPESPRNVIEALARAIAPVGYDDPYARSALDGVGRLTEQDPKTLARTVVQLGGDREALGQTIRAARAASLQFIGRHAFRKMAAMIRERLDAPTKPSPEGASDPE